MYTAKGTFEVKGMPQPPLGAIAHTSFDKIFSGPLSGTSVVQMLSVKGDVQGSAAYVAIERIEGTLDGKKGSFYLHHTGRMDRGTPSLAIAIVPDTGTGALVGIRGTMTIENSEGKHAYTIAYELVQEAQNAGD